MLRIELVALDLVRRLRPLLEAVGRRDRSLEDQLRRALSSVVLGSVSKPWTESSGSVGAGFKAHFSKKYSLYFEKMQRRKRSSGACSATGGVLRQSLNLAEGSHSRGKNKPARYQTALASGKEVRAGLLLAQAYGYSTVDEICFDKLDQVLATLYRLVHRR